MPMTAYMSMEGLVGEGRVHAIRGRERISEPFRYEIDFSCSLVQPDTAIGGGVLVDLVGEFEGHSRSVTGAVEDLEMLILPPDSGSGWPRHRITLRPKPYLALAYRCGYRIFQEMTVVDIVKKVFTDAGLPDDLFIWDTQESYKTRTYTVQYDESEWDFICRLLAEEGIYYCFEHAPDGHVMRLLDKKEQAPKLDTYDVEYLEDPRLGAEKLGAWWWMTHADVSVSKVTLNDYDMLKPSTSLLTDPPAEQSDVTDREHYEYPGYYDDIGEGKRRAQVRLDALRSHRNVSTARTSALGLNAGMKFQLVGHDVGHGEHLCIGMDLHMRLDTAGEGPLTDAGAPTVEMRIETIPADQQFRAPSLPKPVALGCQTATVTGPSGEEIHCDEHGRIKVQFRWDRDGELDEHTTCWIRVAQPHTTGSFMVPRIGWEVFVEFVDGDPDRPLVMGRVWNPFANTYYSLPNDKNWTAHASMSSPGGDGLNEIVLDDSAGAERIAITAKHNVKLVAANNRTFSSGNHAQHTVSGNRSASVGGNESCSISANLGANVTGDMTCTVGGNRDSKSSGSVACEVTGSFDLTCSTEMIKVGNAMAAILEVIAAEAIEAATGALAAKASRAAESLLGPVMPAISAAREAAGSVAQFAGPAAALLGGDNAMLNQVASAAGQIADTDAASLGGQIATNMLNANLASQAASALSKAVRGGGGGGGGGGPGGSAGATSDAAGASSGGSGEWRTTVGGAVTESIGGAAILTTARGLTITVGGARTETIGGARIEAIKGGKNEVTGAAKAETVGVYMVKAATSMAVTAKAAIALNVAGSSKQNIGGGYSMGADGPVLVTAPKLAMKAGQITITCGGSKLVIKPGGIVVDGDSTLEIKGTIKLDPAALGQ